MGIEATSQFTNPHSEEEVELFREVAKQQYKTLKSQQKEYLSPRHSKTDGLQLAKQFMKDYLVVGSVEGRNLGFLWLS